MRNGLEDVVEEDAPLWLLVVDPDRRVLAALRALIDAQPGLKVLAAVSDPEDVPTGAGLPPSGMALVDVSPPGDHGLVLVHTLSRTPRWRVVAMSIRSSSKRAAEEAGASAFVTKGDDLDSLLHAIRQATSGN